VVIERDGMNLVRRSRQSYDAGYAAVYDVYLGGFGKHVASKLVELCRTEFHVDKDAKVLDIGCGTGTAAREFIRAGWKVTGIDLSPYMLQHAKAKLSGPVRARRAMFKVADARRFEVGSGYEFVYSILDCIDHLPDANARRDCFRRAYDAAAPGGHFVFTIVTEKRWEDFSGFTAKDGRGGSISMQGVYDAFQKSAVLEVAGYRPARLGLFRRFATVMHFTLHDPRQVREDLATSGWRVLRVSTLENLRVAARRRSKADRLFFVCSKPLPLGE